NQMACDCRLAWILQIENATQSEKFRRELRHVSCVFSDPARGKSKVTRLSMEDLGCTGQEEPLPTTPSYTISPSYSPEEKSHQPRFRSHNETTVGHGEKRRQLRRAQVDNDQGQSGVIGTGLVTCPVYGHHFSCAVL
ncbi:hypothetical protein MRX96_050031, partial [Rhipicephalus microplus]